MNVSIGRDAHYASVQQTPYPNVVSTSHITDKFALLLVTAANSVYAADKSDLYY
jgi:hypothetical protein